jgi:NadR type nicotinamide-nucleotide adenylyltransferase
MEKNTGPIGDLKKIAIVGPESTGKSTLSMMLADHYNTNWVREYAREYIDNLLIPYQKEDLNMIAKGQIEAEDHLAKSANKLLICDTNLIVIKIWSEYKYGSCENWILEEICRRKYDLHLLTYIDIPWENDPQREHPDKREHFFNIYRQELEARKLKYKVVRGSIKERFEFSVSEINALF